MRHRPRPAWTRGTRPPGADQREVRRQQRLEPDLLQAEEEARSQPPGDVGPAQTARSSRSSTGLSSRPRRQSSPSARSRLTDEEMLARCGRCCRTHGCLSGLIIDETEDAVEQRLPAIASAACCAPTAGRLHAGARLPLRRDQPVAAATASRDRGRNRRRHRGGRGHGRSGPGDRPARRSTASSRLSIVIARCQQTAGRRPALADPLRHRAPPRHHRRGAHGRRNRAAARLLPASRGSTWRHQVRLAEDNGLSLDAYRFDTLDALFELAARVQLSEVA